MLHFALLDFYSCNVICKNENKNFEISYIRLVLEHMETSVNMFFFLEILIKIQKYCI